MSQTEYVRWLTLPEVCNMTGFKMTLVRSAIKRGLLKATKPGGVNRIRVLSSDLHKWMTTTRVAKTRERLIEQSY